MRQNRVSWKTTMHLVPTTAPVSEGALVSGEPSMAAVEDLGSSMPSIEMGWIVARLPLNERRKHCLSTSMPTEEATSGAVSFVSAWTFVASVVATLACLY